MSTYSSLHFHIVFGTKQRRPMLHSSWRHKLFRYMGGTIRGLGGVALNIGGIEDHIHLLVGLTPSHQIPDVVRELKKSSTHWIRKTQHQPGFQWQQGYAVFSVSRSGINDVSTYITRQEMYHKKISFPDEYRRFLEVHGISFEERYALESEE